MNSEQASAWLPVVRDYTLLVVGLGLAIYGIVTDMTALASAGFGLAGMGAAGKALGKTKEPA